MDCSIGFNLDLRIRHITKKNINYLVHLSKLEGDSNAAQGPYSVDQLHQCPISQS